MTDTNPKQECSYDSDGVCVCPEPLDHVLRKPEKLSPETLRSFTKHFANEKGIAPYEIPGLLTGIALAEARLRNKTTGEMHEPHDNQIKFWFLTKVLKAASTATANPETSTNEHVVSLCKFLKGHFQQKLEQGKEDIDAAIDTAIARGDHVDVTVSESSEDKAEKVVLSVDPKREEVVETKEVQQHSEEPTAPVVAEKPIEKKLLIEEVKHAAPPTKPEPSPISTNRIDSDYNYTDAYVPHSSAILNTVTTNTFAPQNITGSGFIIVQHHDSSDSDSDHEDVVNYDYDEKSHNHKLQQRVGGLNDVALADRKKNSKPRPAPILTKKQTVQKSATTTTTAAKKLDVLKHNQEKASLDRENAMNNAITKLIDRNKSLTERIIQLETENSNIKTRVHMETMAHIKQKKEKAMHSDKTPDGDDNTLESDNAKLRAETERLNEECNRITAKFTNLSKEMNLNLLKTANHIKSLDAERKTTAEQRETIKELKRAIGDMKTQLDNVVKAHANEKSVIHKELHKATAALQKRQELPIRANSQAATNGPLQFMSSTAEVAAEYVDKFDAEKAKRIIGLGLKKFVQALKVIRVLNGDLGALEFHKSEQQELFKAALKGLFDGKDFSKDPKVKQLLLA